MLHESRKLSRTFSGLFVRIRPVYSRVIKVEGFVSRRDHQSPFLFFKCRLGLPVVCKVSGVVSMKSIDMYIVHDSILVVCFSNISAHFA